MTEQWLEDTCPVCNVTDTNYLDSACEECTAIMENKSVVSDFMGKIDAYLGSN